MEFLPRAFYPRRFHASPDQYTAAEQSASPDATPDLRSKFATLVDRNHKVKLAYNQLQSQIKFGFLEVRTCCYAVFIFSSYAGVTYANPAIDLGSAISKPEDIVSKVVSMNFKAVRLVGANLEIIRAFAYSNVSLLLSLENTMVALFAANSSMANMWLVENVLPFFVSSNIAFIFVGEEVIYFKVHVLSHILQVMELILHDLNMLGIFNISVSTSLASVNFSKIPLVIIETGWPSSGNDDASTINNLMFLTGLSSRLERPMLGGIVSHVFLYELFDSARKVGEWGILYHNMTPKLELDFSPKKHAQSHFNWSLLLKILISILALTGISGF
ncbi:unnamed protein product [Cochlearia groenlandica]